MKKQLAVGPIWISGSPETLLERFIVAQGRNADEYSKMLAAIKEAVNNNNLELQAQRSESANVFADFDQRTSPSTQLDELGSVKGDAYTHCVIDVDFPCYFEILPDSYKGSAILFWQSPLTALLGMKNTPLLAKDGDIGLVLESWRQYHEKLLGVFRSWPGKTLLIRADRLGGVLGDSLVVSVGEVCAGPPEPFLFDSLRDCVSKALNQPQIIKFIEESHLETLISDGYPSCYDLYMELEACSALLGREAELDAKYLDPRDSAREVLKLIYQIGKQFEGESETAQAEIESLVGERDSLAGQRDKLQADLESITSQLKGATEESELLLLQLHQVQEELEHYFLEYQQTIKLLDRFQESQKQTRTLVSRLFKHYNADRFQSQFPM